MKEANGQDFQQRLISLFMRNLYSREVKSVEANAWRDIAELISNITVYVPIAKEGDSYFFGKLPNISMPPGSFHQFVLIYTDKEYCEQVIADYENVELGSFSLKEIAEEILSTKRRFGLAFNTTYSHSLESSARNTFLMDDLELESLARDLGIDIENLGSSKYDPIIPLELDEEAEIKFTLDLSSAVYELNSPVMFKDFRELFATPSIAKSKVVVPVIFHIDENGDTDETKYDFIALPCECDEPVHNDAITVFADYELFLSFPHQLEDVEPLCFNFDELLLVLRARDDRRDIGFCSTLSPFATILDSHDLDLIHKLMDLPPRSSSGLPLN